MHQSAKFSLAAGIALAVAACGGGGGGGTSSSSVTSSGTISGFGSFYVNGVRYTTNSETEIEFEDEGLVTEDRLRLGMKVTVKGTRNGTQGTASKILFDSELKGTVDGAPTIDPDNANVGSFTVGGFTVTTNSKTAFDDSIGDLTGLSGGEFVEVSAYPTSTGFVATRVELETDPFGPGDFEVKGVVSDQNFIAGISFEIQGVTINLLPGTTVEAGVAEGVFVEVKGTPNSGAIDADVVEIEDDLFEDAFDDEIEVEGILERSGGTIRIGGYEVSDPNGLLDAFNDGDKVEVELSPNGIVVEVELEVEETVRIEDEVFSRSPTSFTTRLGLTITPEGAVRLEDDLPALKDDDQITVSEFMGVLQENDRIEARGFPTGSGVTWTEIEREEPDTGCRLRGLAESGEAPLVIQGVDIDTSGAQFKNDDVVLTGGATEFFDLLSADDVVEAKTDLDGGCQDGRLIAQEVSFEPADD